MVGAPRFGEQAQARYAESWAFLHFLRRSGSSYNKVFNALFETPSFTS